MRPLTSINGVRHGDKRIFKVMLENMTASETPHKQRGAAIRIAVLFGRLCNDLKS